MIKTTDFFKQKKVNIYMIILLIVSGLGVYGISYLSSLIMGNYFSNGMISFFCFLVVFGLLKKTFEDFAGISERKSGIKRGIYAFLTAFLFALTMIVGYQLRMNGMTECGFVGKGLIVLRSLCLSIPVFPFTNYLFGWLEKAHERSQTAVSGKLWKSRNVFLISWGVIFLCWIPVFLAYYPAIMSFDFHRQSIEAAKGFIWFNSYQPLAHTWLIWVALQIGYAVGSLEVGMACFSIFQMIVFSAACGYSCVTMYRLVKKKWPVVLMVLFYGVFPFISVLAVCTTKDVMFSALFLVFICLFVERTFLCTPEKQKIVDILWVLEGIIMMLFRNNAIYAVAVFAVFAVILAEKKQRLRLLLICITLVVGGKGALEGMYVLIGTEGRGSQIEMFSVPIQQFARVGYYHGDELDEETREMLEKYVPADLWESYNPPLSDTVKGVLGAYIFDENWKTDYPQLLKDWIALGLKYPNEYIDAFLELTAGYWFFDDVTWAEVLGSGLEDRMGAIYTYTSSTSEEIPEGIAHISKFPVLESILENIVSANCFFDWPVISNLFKPAFYCWTLLLNFIACIYIGDKKKTMVLILPILYLATMFLGPVVQVRYILPVMVIVPMMMAVWYRREQA